MKQQCPIPKILLPVDGSENSKNAVQFAGCLGAFMGESLLGLTLLHVMAGGYLSRHMANVDFRTEVLMQSEMFKRIKEEHMTKDIMPILDDAEKILKDAGVKPKIEKLIVDGDPANEIIRVANQGNYSTIIMARSQYSGMKELLLSDVTNKVVHATSRQTLYIVGQKIISEKACPIPRILIPVDGSSYSVKGIEHAACLVSSLKGSIGGITLLRVINLALYAERLTKGIDPHEEAKKILDEAKGILLQAGISEKLVTYKIMTGNPADEILKEADEGNHSLLIMGRKGRTALKDLLLGGVSSSVLHRSQNQTIAIVSSE